MSDFTIARIFDSPRHLVYDCWVKPEHFVKWGLSPAGCTCKLLHADVSPGGYYHLQEAWPNGRLMYVKHEFQQIDSGVKLVFVTSLCNERGETVKNPFNPNWPEKLLTTVTFEDEGSGTKVTANWDLINPSPSDKAYFLGHQEGGRQGWSETFVRLQDTIEMLEK